MSTMFNDDYLLPNVIISGVNSLQDQIDREDMQQANLLAFFQESDYVERSEFFFKLKQELEDHKIKWALVCSCSLFFCGFVDDFHDFDIVVDETDFERITRILKDLGAELIDRSSTALFKSDRYAHYRAGPVDLDVISGFRVCSFGTSFHYELKPISVVPTNVPYVGTIPILALEIQFILYAMMEGGQQRRRFKRQLLENYLSFHGIRAEVLEHEYHDEGLGSLPQWIKTTLSTFHTR